MRSKEFRSDGQRREKADRSRRMNAHGTLSQLSTFIVLVMALQISAGRAKAADQILAKVSVNPNSLGVAIPKDYVGFSLEVSPMGQALPVPPESLQFGKALPPGTEFEYALGNPGAPNRAFFQFMRNLPPSILRLGGNSQDNTCWDKKDAPHADWCQAEILPGDLKLYSQAAQATGWHLILGINLKQNAPAWALGEVSEGVRRNVAPGEIADMELGNEPSLFPRDGSRPRNYSPEDHAKEFAAYAQALKENSFAKQFSLAGPAQCCSWENTKDLETFMSGVSRKNLQLLTVHEYVKTVCGGRLVTIPELLAPETTSSFVDRAKDWIAAAHRFGIPIALAETNSASCGGMTGVSNAFASAVWGLDYMFETAEEGFRYINFHMSYKTGGSAYNPIVTAGAKDSSGHWSYTNIAEPLYYAMYAFAHNASGERLVPASIETSANVLTHAVTSCRGCAVKVFVINKDTAASGQVHVSVAGRKSPASLLFLQAPNLSSTAGDVRYGGVQFDDNGRLPSPHSETIKPDSTGQYIFNLSNASTAILTVPGSAK